MTLEQGKTYNICGAAGTGTTHLAVHLLDLFFPSHTIITNNQEILKAIASIRTDHEYIDTPSQLKYKLDHYTPVKHVFVSNDSFNGVYAPSDQTQIIITTSPLVALRPFLRPLHGVIFTSWKNNKQMACPDYQRAASALDQSSKEFDVMFTLNNITGKVTSTSILDQRLAGLNKLVDEYVVIPELENFKLPDNTMTSLVTSPSQSVAKATLVTSPKENVLQTPSNVLTNDVKWEKNKLYTILGASRTGKTWLAKYYLDKYFSDHGIITNDQELYHMYNTSGASRCCFADTLYMGDYGSQGIVYVIDLQKNSNPNDNPVIKNTSMILMSQKYYDCMVNSEILVASKDKSKLLVPNCCRSFTQNIKDGDCDLLLTPPPLSGVATCVWNASVVNVRKEYLNQEKQNPITNFDTKSENVAVLKSDNTTLDAANNVEWIIDKTPKNISVHVNNNNNAPFDIPSKAPIKTKSEPPKKIFNVLCWSLEPHKWYRTSENSDTKITFTSAEYRITGTLVQVVHKAFDDATCGFLMSQRAKDLDEIKFLPIAPGNIMIKTTMEDPNMYFQWNDSILVYDYKDTHYLDGTLCNYEIIDVRDGKLSLNKQYEIVNYYDRINSKNKTFTFVLVKCK